MIATGSRVVKKGKGGKRFMNGEKVAIVRGFTTITFPRSNSRYARGKAMKIEGAAVLEGCEQPIRLKFIALAE